ncbi:MAG: M50 family metallopeptidase, partial [Anaerolineales bacterium]|nr:M50 family metallopeptidase [Anaerolineales bacterium]
MSISPETLNQLLQFILGLAVLIFLHESGHFLAARLFKVEVEEFGIGFPPRLVKLFEAGGTKFTLNWIPLGGFVRIKGENDPEVPGGLAASKPWVRLAVLFAGPLTNLLLGVVLAVVLFYNLGEPVLDKVVVQQVAPNSPAQQAGLLPGDVILSVEGQPVTGIEDLQEAIRARLGLPTRLGYQRGDQQAE